MGIANSRRGINHRKVEIVYTSLGWHRPLQELASSAILSALTFFYIYTVGSFLNVRVFLLEGGITYGFPFDIYIFDMQIDQAILAVGTLLWFAFSLRDTRLKVAVCTFYGTVTLISFTPFGYGILETLSLIFGPLIIIALILNSFLKSEEKKCSNIFSFNKRLYLTYVSIIAISIGIISLLLNSDILFHIDKVYLRDYVYQVYLVLASLSPVVLVLLVFGVPVKLISDKVINKITCWNDIGGLDNRDPKAGLNDDRHSNRVKQIQKKTGQNRKLAIYLILIMAESSALTLIPWYSTIINGSELRLIGVDTGFYVKWARDLISTFDREGILEVLNQVFVVAADGDRPISLLFVFSVAKMSQAFGEISGVINSIPAILAPLLVLAVFFMTREMTLYIRAALFAALLTTVSFQISVGIYAGFYANWLALIVGYLCFGFLFRYLRSPSKSNLTLFLTLNVFLLFTHVYTWAMFTVGMVIFLLVLTLRSYYSKRILRMPLLVILCVAIIYGIKSNLSGTGIDTELVQVQIVEIGPNFETLAERWNTITNATHQFVGGLFGSSIIYLLGLYWLVKCRLKVPSNLFMFVLLSTAVVPLLVGSWVVQSRVIYNIPFQIPAAIAMVYILQTAKESRMAQYPEFDKELFIIAIFVWTFAISLRLLLNLSSLS